MELIFNGLKITGALVAIIGSMAWIWEYRLKVRAERRLAESSRIESQIKLLTLFAEIMNIAHGRGGYEVSEKALEKILTPEILKSFEPGTESLKNLLTNSLIHIPVGSAAQDAAVASIWQLGKEYDVLRDASIQGLKSICTFKEDVARRYLEDLQIQGNNH